MSSPKYNKKIAPSLSSDEDDSSRPSRQSPRSRQRPNSARPVEGDRTPSSTRHGDRIHDDGGGIGIPTAPIPQYICGLIPVTGRFDEEWKHLKEEFNLCFRYYWKPGDPKGPLKGKAEKQRALAEAEKNKNAKQQLEEHLKAEKNKSEKDKDEGKDKSKEEGKDKNKGKDTDKDKSKKEGVEIRKHRLILIDRMGTPMSNDNPEEEIQSLKTVQVHEGLKILLSIAKGEILGVHRGILMSCDEYHEFYWEFLKRFQIRLIVSPQQYERTMHFPMYKSILEAAFWNCGKGDSKDEKEALKTQKEGLKHLKNILIPVKSVYLNLENFPVEEDPIKEIRNPEYFKWEQKIKDIEEKERKEDEKAKEKERKERERIVRKEKERKEKEEKARKEKEERERQEAIERGEEPPAVEPSADEENLINVENEMKYYITGGAMLGLKDSEAALGEDGTVDSAPPMSPGGTSINNKSNNKSMGPPIKLPPPPTDISNNVIDPADATKPTPRKRYKRPEKPPKFITNPEYVRITEALAEKKRRIKQLTEVLLDKIGPKRPIDPEDPELDTGPNIMLRDFLQRLKPLAEREDESDGEYEPLAYPMPLRSQIDEWTGKPINSVADEEVAKKKKEELKRKKEKPPKDYEGEIRANLIQKPNERESDAFYGIPAYIEKEKGKGEWVKNTDLIVKKCLELQKLKEERVAQNGRNEFHRGLVIKECYPLAKYMQMNSEIGGEDRIITNEWRVWIAGLMHNVETPTESLTLDSESGEVIRQRVPTELEEDADKDTVFFPTSPVSGGAVAKNNIKNRPSSAGSGAPRYYAIRNPKDYRILDCTPNSLQVDEEGTWVDVERPSQKLLNYCLDVAAQIASPFITIDIAEVDETEEVQGNRMRISTISSGGIPTAHSTVSRLSSGVLRRKSTASGLGPNSDETFKWIILKVADGPTSGNTPGFDILGHWTTLKKVLFDGKR